MQVLKMADLRAMTPEKRARALNDLADAAMAPRNGQAGYLRSQIEGYETKYHLTSDEMLGKLRAGVIVEDQGISEWLFWLSIERDANQSARA
jgi:hypothetical protein